MRSYVLAFVLTTAILTRRQLARPPILPALACTGIVLLPSALSHLQTSSAPPSDDSRTQRRQRQAILQGVFCEGPVTGAHGLLANILVATEATPNGQRRVRHHR